MESGRGPDNFASDPPNATLSVYEPGHHANTLTVVKISHPVLEGPDLVYRYKLIEGTMPKAGGATALFIDWIGAGGGRVLVFTASGPVPEGLALPVVTVGRQDEHAYRGRDQSSGRGNGRE